MDFIKTFEYTIEFYVIFGRSSIHIDIYLPAFQPIMERVDRPAIFISHCVKLTHRTDMNGIIDY